MFPNAKVSNTKGKGFILLWLDAEVNRNEENRNAQEQLRRIITCVKTFESRNDCEKYIRSTSFDEQLLLIVSGRLGRELVPSIHQLPQVVSIYVYCQDKQGHEQWANHFTKVKAVIIQVNELISQIRIQQENSVPTNKMQLPDISSSSNLTKQSISEGGIQLAYSYLLADVLCRMKTTEMDKKEFISRCKDMYQGNYFELHVMDEFQQEYTSSKAIWWYTRDCFLSRVLIQALSTQDIDMILLCQFFIDDLHRQIREYQCPSRVKVYRSQQMSDDHFEQLKDSVGGLISWNIFLTTSLDRHAAPDFLSTNIDSNDLHKTLVKIDADPTVTKTKYFANVTEHSFYPDKQRVLFSIGSFFRIRSFEQKNDHQWNTRMTLCADDDPDLKALRDTLTELYGYDGGETAFISFSRVLREMQNFDGAEKYCLRLLRDYSTDVPLLAMLYDELSEIASSKGDHHLSTQWREKALALKKNSAIISSGVSGKGVNSNDDHASSDIRDSNDSTSIGTTSNPTAAEPHSSQENHRFTDVISEKHDILLPIEGYEKMPVVTLEEAIVPLIPILPDIRRKAHTAKQKCKNPADGLTPNQSAAIMLYTMEWEPREECLYFALNTCLRAAERKKLKPWFSYLKLVLTGLSRLPSIQRTIYRGVRCDLSAIHHEGDQFFWWGFSSCTTTMTVLKSDQFLGNSGIRTFFIVECINAKDIRRHSYYQNEDEILLLPATYLQVLTCYEMASGLHTIQLKEIKPEYPYLEPVN